MTTPISFVPAVVVCLILLGITQSFALATKNPNKKVVSSSSTSLLSELQNWIDAVKPIVEDGDEDDCTRLQDFSHVLWNIHKNPNVPTHQLYLTSRHQQCSAPFPFLQPAQPLHDPDNFKDWVLPLEASWKTVQQELESYLQTLQQEKESPWKTSTTNLCQDTTGFEKLCLQNEDGQPTLVGQAYFPKTLALLHSTVGPQLAPRPIHINCQAPNSGLAPHSDNMNFLLACHLGLLIPKRGDCIFHLEPNVEYKWKKGKVVIADTSFVHSTQNLSPDESRYILSFCIWHPDLSAKEREGIVALHSIVQQFASDKNDTG